MDGALVSHWLCLLPCPVPRRGAAWWWGGILGVHSLQPLGDVPTVGADSPQKSPPGDSCSSQPCSSCLLPSAGLCRLLGAPLGCSPAPHPLSRTCPPPPLPPKLAPRSPGQLAHWAPAGPEVLSPSPSSKTNPETLNHCLLDKRSIKAKPKSVY